MLKGGSSREHTLTDQALAHVRTDDDEHLANLVASANLVAADGTRLLPSFVVSSHVDQQ
jgi:hypothetical protein